MARMIPSFFDPANPSPAEGRIFELLKYDPAAADWVVLHSLGLARRAAKPYGEIDFVVLIPGTGVFCLEVKGGRVSCHEGKWESMDRDGVVHAFNRSPFLQAREGMFEVRKAVLDRAPMGFPPGMVYGYAVVLPDISFTVVSPEWESWQVIDRDALARPVSTAVLRLAANMRKLTPFAPTGEPGPATVRMIQQLLRPDFEIVMSCGAQIDETELQLRRLTEEQFDGLDLLAENPRCLAEGAAGTGKTMLAVEHACRSAAAGKRTLLICYNRLLGNWLVKRAAEAGHGPRLVAGSFFRLVRDIIVRSSFKDDFLKEERSGPADRVFTECYPYFGELAVEETNERFDALVMDEAQDLLRPGVVQILTALLRGGMTGGNWAVFGDFQRQAIYNASPAGEMKALLTTAAPGLTRVPLRMNCRNTRNIGEETALLSGFDSPPYRMGQAAGLPVDYQYYGTDGDQCVILADVLRRLLKGGVKAADIVVLSPVVLSKSGAVKVEGGTEFRMVEVDDELPAKSRVPLIRFVTAQAFKGMESTVVVLCDIEQITDQAPQSLLYVAMSRARSHLTVLLRDKTRPHMNERIRQKLQANWNKNP